MEQVIIDKILDKGYVRLVDHMGSDLSVVNAARVSFDKESKELTEADKKLIRFLAREDHTSPFRHGILSFEIYAPLMVARQWWKYIVGSDHAINAWNESSRRYVTEEPNYYVIDEWRMAPANKKQGSGNPIPSVLGEEYTARLIARYEQSIIDYEDAIRDGICPEQARVFLLANALYVRWRWTASLHSVIHFLGQRLDSDAQWEISQYAKAVWDLTHPLFTESLEAFNA